MLDGVYRTTGEGVTAFHPAPAPTDEQLQALLDKIITRILRLLTREGHLVEEEGLTYVADAHGTCEGVSPAQPDFDAERLPTVYDGRPFGNAGNPAGGDKELAKKGIERADETGMPQGNIDSVHMASPNELFDSGIRE